MMVLTAWFRIMLPSRSHLVSTQHQVCNVILDMTPGQQSDLDLQIRAQSENDADDELLSVVLLKGDKKVVTGTQSGVINLYSWGHMDDCSDRFPGKNYP
jgi:hypothetical protein